jgi:hypothetical protein
VSGSKSPADWRVIESSLRARGLWNEDGISRRARARFCRKCRAPIMVGLDSDVMGTAAVCDPAPINVLGEVQALMTGRATYALRWLGGRWEIDHRDSFQIKGSPAGSNPRYEVLAEHRCHAPINAANMRAPYLERPGDKKAESDDDNPPF